MLACVVDTAACNDDNVAVFANVEIVVNKLFKTCLSDENGNVYALLLCAGLDVDVNTGQVFLLFDDDVLAGVLACKLPFIRRE